jgi:hypothetical protein
MPHVIKTTGGAVGLCSLTTVIGYLTLIIAKNQALVSFRVGFDSRGSDLPRVRPGAHAGDRHPAGKAAGTQA